MSSTSVQLNEPAPDFELPDLEGAPRRLSAYRGRIVVLNFWSCECPHAERVDQALAPLLTEWGADVALLALAANRNETLEALQNSAHERGLPVVLRDADCLVANLYEAQTTPHVFLIDREGVLRYRGAADDVTFRNRVPSRFYLAEAVNALRAGALPALAETPPLGCAIVREI